MKYAIIAAGEGSRLAQEGVMLPKPLVTLQGEPMILRLINIFRRCNAESITIIVNGFMTPVHDFLRSLELDVPLNVVVKTTPSSMHSFWELSRVLGEGKLCLTTVDTIFREDDFARYIAEWEHDNCHDGLWAVTPWVDDEKPLWVDVDSQMRVTRFGDTKGENSTLVSGGIYAMTHKAFPVLDRCIAQGVSRMRNFQRELLADGFNIKAHVMPKIVDVDHASDIATAEQFLNSTHD